MYPLICSSIIIVYKCFEYTRIKPKSPSAGLEGAVSDTVTDAPPAEDPAVQAPTEVQKYMQCLRKYELLRLRGYLENLLPLFTP